jgi:hypothetical protein
VPSRATVVSFLSRNVSGDWSVRTRSCTRSGTSSKELAPSLRRAQDTLLATKAVGDEFIEKRRERCSVTRMCEAQNVSPSGYHARRKGPVNAREMINRDLANRMKAVYYKRYDMYGSPLVYRELRAQGEACSERPVAPSLPKRGSSAVGTSKSELLYHRVCRGRDEARPDLILVRILQSAPTTLVAGVSLPGGL